MRSERRKQIMTLSILVVAILAISVGFAAFSTTLRINSTATVNPDSSDFSVVFSTTNGSTATSGTVSPVLNASTETGTNSNFTATDVTIEENSTTLTDLSATFVSPGDSVTYTFYAVNTGAYTAYLNNVNFLGEKSCTAGEGADANLVSSACESISVSVSVGGTAYTTTTGVTGHSLVKQTGEEIVVTLTYDSNGSRADGPFSVEFPSIALVYSTIDDSNVEITKVCKLVSGDVDTVGSIIECASESFYVVPDQPLSTEGTVSMLAAKNIEITTTNPKQSDSAGTTTYLTDYSNTSDGPYSDVLNVYKYNQAYKKTLEDLGIEIEYVVLLAEDVLSQYYTCDNNGTNCGLTYSWLYSTSYIAAGNGVSATLINIDGTLTYSNDPMGQAGIRPVVIVNVSEIG